MAYAAASDLIARKDSRVLGDLVSDDDTRVAEGSLAANTYVTAALDDASGDIDAALLVGNRYTAADLSGLTGNSLALLKRITCEIAMFHLLGRRPEINADTWEHYAKVRENLLEPLRRGDAVFGDIEASRNAGAPDVDGPSTDDYNDLNLIRDRVTGYFPRRRNPGNR